MSEENQLNVGEKFIRALQLREQGRDEKVVPEQRLQALQQATDDALNVLDSVAMLGGPCLTITRSLVRWCKQPGFIDRLTAGRSEEEAAMMRQLISSAEQVLELSAMDVEFLDRYMKMTANHILNAISPDNQTAQTKIAEAWNKSPLSKLTAPGNNN